ncbi:tyrosine-type recombinase/integrase [Streptacidiphilus sp. EB103A]|uniref:tyrosine-type recombinase/integrase n=1 Tax=Streptacidiphilus sp. EB103A TaxID=3156275 RepID=UPI00351822CE
MTRIFVVGPLAGHEAGLRLRLTEAGYALDTVRGHVRLLSELSGWLDGHGLGTADLSDVTVRQFVADRRGAGLRTGRSVRALAPILSHLVAQQVLSPSAATDPSTWQEVLLAQYSSFLEGERAVSAGTLKHYRRCARVFLDWASDSEDCVSRLEAGQVTAYVMDWARRREGGRPDMVTLPALRSFLRFLHVAGHVRDLLVGAVPVGRGHPGRHAVPRAAAAHDIQAVLDSCDRQTAIGCRDYAIVLSLTRLALRGGEVAKMRLEDIDWHAGQVAIHGKGNRRDMLPLPADVGQAWAEYLLTARPRTAAATLFVTAKAPFTALAVSSVTLVLARACTRAGVARFGPHRVRHAAACGLLQAGASMEEIGQLLRHAQQRTTAIYAKVDQQRLSPLARPCPQAVAR